MKKLLSSTLRLDTIDIILGLGVVVILNIFEGDSGGEGICVRCELG